MYGHTVYIIMLLSLLSHIQDNGLRVVCGPRPAGPLLLYKFKIFIKQRFGDENMSYQPCNVIHCIVLTVLNTVC